MSGHSHWATIKHKKGAIDAKRGKLFSKLSRAIIIAARHGGGDPEMNLKLRYAIDKARQVSMPKDNIERAVKRGTGEVEGMVFEEITYEGYGPGGVAVLVDVVTDNRNRTSGEVRKIFERNGGKMGSAGCVAYLFERKGVISVNAADTDEDTLMGIALDAGADDLKRAGSTFDVTCEPAAFGAVQAAIEKAGLKPVVAEISQVPKAPTEVDTETAKKVMRLMEGLDDHDDVQNVYTSMNLTEEMAAEMANSEERGRPASGGEMPMADFDSPWKEALDVYFRAFVAFFFPPIHDDIDWSRGFESLDTELQQIAPKAAHGRRCVDKLVKVWRTNGREAWVLIHVEVQTQRDRAFSRRMYVYHYRIFDRYNRRVASLAVLADDNPHWRPGAYRDELWGCSIRLTFPAVKLLDYAERVAALEADSNPFAKVVLAHLKALETRRDPEGRRAWKFRLVRGLYERGFRPEEVRQLWRLIDWLMELPPPLERALQQDLDEFEEGRHMPFVDSFERRGMQKGLLRAIESSLRVKFGEEGLGLLPQIQALDDADKFLAIQEAIVRADDLEEVRRACAAAAAPTPAPRKKNSRGKPRTP